MAVASVPGFNNSAVDEFCDRASRSQASPPNVYDAEISSAYPQNGDLEPEWTMQNETQKLGTEAIAQMRESLCDLFGNLLRISRSRDGGSPHELIGQCAAVVEAYSAHVKAAGHGIPSYEFRETIAIGKVLPESDRDIDDAFVDIISGSFQMMASHLLDDRLRVFKGRSQIVDGIHQRERAVEEMRTKRFGASPS